jgi:hypothetical protein
VNEADREARRAIEEGNQIARVRANQAELIDAFRAKHGLEPEDVCVDIRRLPPDGRIIWNVRKMSVSERAAQRQLALKSDAEALGRSTKPVHAFVVLPPKPWSRLLLWMFAHVAKVHLTEQGARGAAGTQGHVVRVELGR